MKTVTSSRLLIVFLALLVSFSCGEKSPPEQNDTTESKIVADEIEVHVYYDNTPGFLQPALRYAVKISARRTTDGVVDWFKVESNDVTMGILHECDANAAPDVWTLFDFHQVRWGKAIANVGDPVVCNITIRSSNQDAGQLALNVTRPVEQGDFPIVPRSNSRQLAAGLYP